MSNFNNIFGIVQNHCQKDAISGRQRFRKIASEAGVSEERLHFYLDCLREVGVIEYSSDDRKVSLTPKGAKAGRIFPN